MNLFNLFLQSNDGVLGGLIGSTVLIAISMVGVFAILFVIAGWWKMFDKAAQPGWMALIPILNVYILLKIAGRPGWWLILYLIPIVQIVVNIIVAIDLGKAFSKDTLYSLVLLFLFAPIGYIILGFSDAVYEGPAKGY